MKGLHISDSENIGVSYLRRVRHSLHASAMTPPEYVGSAEVVRLLGKSSRTVHRLVKAGRLRPALVAPGGQHGAFLFERKAVERLRDELDAAKAGAR